MHSSHHRFFFLFWPSLGGIDLVAESTGETLLLPAGGAVDMPSVTIVSS